MHSTAAMALRRLAAHKHALAGLAGLGLGVVAPSVAFAEKKDDAGRPLFDPEALERGAAALREINKSPYAKQVRSWRSRTRIFIKIGSDIKSVLSRTC